MGRAAWPLVAIEIGLKLSVLVGADGRQILVPEDVGEEIEVAVEDLQEMCDLGLELPIRVDLGV